MIERIQQRPEKMDNVAYWNNQNPSSESAEMRCSNLDVPLITFEDIRLVISSCLNPFSYEYWTELANDTVHSDHFLLRNMCQTLLEDICALVLKAVKMQLLSQPHLHVPTHGDGTTSNLIYAEPLYDGCTYCRVTEDDIQTAFNNLLHKCFGQALGVEQKQSYDSDRLLTLFSAQIAKNVNSALRNITGSISLRSEESVVPSHFEEIVGRVINIIITCTTPQISPQTTEGKKSDRDSEKTHGVTLAPVRADDYLDLPDSLKFDSLDSEEVEPVQKTVKGFQNIKNIDFPQCAPTVPRRKHPKYSREELILYACLAELIIHTDKKTRISNASLDLYQIVVRMKENIVEEQSYTLLQNSKNFHVAIYKEMCRKFGSKYMVLAVIEKDGAAFGAAVAEALKAQLKKLAEKKSSKTVWRIFRRNRKVAPISEDKAPESHREEHKQRNRATPLHQNTECCRIVRTFSSMLAGLKKVFTCCITSED